MILMKKLFVYLKPYRKESVLGPLFKFFEACLELAVPLVVAAIIDHGIARADTSYVVLMCLLLVLFGAVGLAFSLTAQYFSAKAAVGFTTGLKQALFEHLQGFSYGELDDLGTSTLITRMTSDMNQVQTGLNLTLRLLLRSPFVVFGAMVMAFTVDASSALIFVGIIPVLFAVVFAIMLACIPLYSRVQGKLDGVLSRTRENVRGVRVIRAFGKEQEEIKDFQKANSDLTRMQKTVGRISALLNPLTYALINVAVLLLIRVGAIRVDAGNMTQGQVVAMYNYMSQILVELIKFANLVINVTKSIACAGRIEAVLSMPATDCEQSASCEGDFSDEDKEEAVCFSGVSFHYKNGGNVLSDISFTVKRGERVGIIGGTGSGKSTLINLIPRFYSASEGNVSVFGQNVCKLKADSLRKRIGVVPQKALLFHGTIRDNLKFGAPDAEDEDMLAALERAQGSDILVAKEGGLDAVITRRGENLSGGQRQRLTIARALVRQPDILILDDSASALDYATDARLRRAIQEMDGNMTVFIVSQRTASISNADKIIVLDDGHMVGMGTHSELLAGCTVYREIHQSQGGREET